jgi:hypothetical protein
VSPPHHAAAGDPTPGRRLCPCTGLTLVRRRPDHWMLGRAGVTALCWAIAPIQALRARARAPTTRCPWLPRARHGRARVHRRPGAFPLIAWLGLGRCSRRHWR